MEVVLRGDKYLGITTREPLKKKKEKKKVFVLLSLATLL